MTGLASNVSASLATVSSSTPSSTSSSKCLPCRTSLHPVDAEPAQRADDRLPLRIEDLRLEDDVDDHASHSDLHWQFEQTRRPGSLEGGLSAKSPAASRGQSAPADAASSATAQSSSSWRSGRSVTLPGGAMFSSRCRARVFASVYLSRPSEPCRRPRPDSPTPPIGASTDAPRRPVTLVDVDRAGVQPGAPPRVPAARSWSTPRR